MKKHVVGFLLATMLVAGGVAAQDLWNGGSTGGGAGGVASNLVCLLTGAANCTMTGGIIFSGVTTDISTPGSEDLAISPGGNVNILRPLRVRNDLAINVQYGTTGYGYFVFDSTASDIQHRIEGGNFGYTGALAQKAIAVSRARTITSPTDTSTQPNHVNITISSSGVAAWTPSETNAINGECFDAVNSSANAITMTDSAGVYEGGAVPCVLGQYDAVRACYYSDRWVEVSCRDN
jgi:hypothetical protein